MRIEDTNNAEGQAAEDMDPSVPTDLMQLHLDLEDAGVTPEEFKALAEGI